MYSRSYKKRRYLFNNIYIFSLQILFAVVMNTFVSIHIFFLFFLDQSSIIDIKIAMQPITANYYLSDINQLVEFFTSLSSRSPVSSPEISSAFSHFSSHNTNNNNNNNNNNNSSSSMNVLNIACPSLHIIAGFPARCVAIVTAVTVALWYDFIHFYFVFYSHPSNIAIEFELKQVKIHNRPAGPDLDAVVWCTEFISLTSYVVVNESKWFIF